MDSGVFLTTKALRRLRAIVVLSKKERAPRVSKIAAQIVSSGNNAHSMRQENSFQWKVFFMLSLRSETAMFPVETLPVPPARKIVSSGKYFRYYQCTVCGNVSGGNIALSMRQENSFQWKVFSILSVRCVWQCFRWQQCPFPLIANSFHWKLFSKRLWAGIVATGNIAANS